MNVLPEDIFVELFLNFLSFDCWASYARTARAQNRAWKVAQGNLRRRWLALCSEQEAKRLNKYGVPPTTLIVRLYKWKPFLRWLRKEKRLPENTKDRIWKSVGATGSKNDTSTEATYYLKHLYLVPSVSFFQPSRVLYEMGQLPYAQIQIKVSPQRTYTLIDKTFIGSVSRLIVASVSKGGLRTTGSPECDRKLLRKLIWVEQHPVLALVECSTRCPWCCLPLDDNRCGGYDCSMKWCEWAAWTEGFSLTQHPNILPGPCRTPSQAGRRASCRRPGELPRPSK